MILRKGFLELAIYGIDISAEWINNDLSFWGAA